MNACIYIYTNMLYVYMSILSWNPAKLGLQMSHVFLSAKETFGALNCKLRLHAWRCWTPNIRFGPSWSTVFLFKPYWAKHTKWDGWNTSHSWLLIIDLDFSNWCLPDFVYQSNPQQNFPYQPDSAEMDISWNSGRNPAEVTRWSSLDFVPKS